MKISYKTLLLLSVTALGLGCGYSKPKASSPAISQLSPASMTAGSAGFQLEVEGTNFVSGAVVNFNGVPEQTSFVSSSKLEATIPGSAIATPATVPVTVTDPAKGSIYGGMGSITSPPMNFSVN
ncbi:MAG TPA: IPT/TIG domain-containing protein [Candidatus Sulfotelmatobacter sp.]|nr:IPT/TIG domain-containing protein [Candidatus Sulfotelmatobacter sp.]